MSNKVGLQEGSLRDIRYRFDLPAQMACSVSRQVDITYKTMVYNVKTTATAWAAGHTKKRYNGLDQTP